MGNEDDNKKKLNLHWVLQKPMCPSNLRNLIYVQERHITNHNVELLGCKGRSIGLESVGFYVLKVLASLDLRRATPGCTNWFRADFPFFLRDMTEINTPNTS
ncbi:hypothetical protein J6590_100312 [Homalodisca vitripennis]|nr:hypothetical protein J6590_092404 [Homalodisca vitripennis]KAG8327421.1 hypothetical protein J6590_020123 [Homalodisca vitripennis]KAG8328847.1 hypothetical protein J6590_100312 [Homalodisca vitripennis]